MSAMSLSFRAGPGGATRTFAFERGLRLAAVASLTFVLLLISAVIVSPAGTQEGLGVWGKVALLALVDIPAGWWAIRWFRLGVRVSAGSVIIRNLWRTRRIGMHEIRDITLETKDVRQEGGRSTPFWMPRIWLTNGDSIWLQGLTCGAAGRAAGRPPEPQPGRCPQ